MRYLSHVLSTSCHVLSTHSYCLFTLPIALSHTCPLLSTYTLSLVLSYALSHTGMSSLASTPLVLRTTPSGRERSLFEAHRRARGLRCERQSRAGEARQADGRVHAAERVAVRAGEEEQGRGRGDATGGCRAASAAVLFRATPRDER